MAEEVIGLDGVSLGTLPEGYKVGSPLGGVGVLEIGRPASENNLKLARRYYAEARAEDFASLTAPDGRSFWVDRASGRLYEERRSDPLLTEKPSEQDVSAFIALDTIRWLVVPSSGPETVVALAEEQAAAERAQQQEEAAIRDFRAKQPQAVLSFADLPFAAGVDPRLTLRGAAQRIESLGGRIERGKHGLRVTIPARLERHQGEFASGMIERDGRADASLAALTLTRAEGFVLAAVDDFESDRSRKRRSLAERLPDAPPSIGSLI
jgi:hypothetical protein